jgi:hypothetical protein
VVASFQGEGIAVARGTWPASQRSRQGAALHGADRGVRCRCGHVASREKWSRRPGQGHSRLLSAPGKSPIQPRRLSPRAAPRDARAPVGARGGALERGAGATSLIPFPFTLV